MKKDWMQFDKDEVEKLIIKFAKEGKTGSEIGIILRDQYGIGSVKKYGLKMSEIINKVEKQEIPEDLYSLLKRVVKIHDHMEKNKKDYSTKYGLQKLESRIRRLSKYYIKKGRLPENWKYTIQRARLLVK